jgi:hypothetical protein
VALCSGGEAPTLGTLLKWAADRGVVLTGSDPSPWTAVDLETRYWQGLGLVDHPDRGPLEFYVHQLDQVRNQFADYLDWYLEGVEAVPASSDRDVVLDHLGRTRFIVALNVSAADLDVEEFVAAVWVLLDYFRAHNDALIHIEGEGFYRERDDLFLELTDY